MINKNKVKVILFDVDNTLVYGKDAQKFYSEYSKTLETLLARRLDTSKNEAKIVADAFRKRFKGHGEKSFDALGIGIDAWYEEIFKIDPAKYIKPMKKSNVLLRELSKEGFIIGAVTDGPTEQSRRIMKVAQIDYKIFDILIGWEKGKEMPKAGSSKIFKDICRERKLKPGNIMMIGDSLSADILPAKSVGLDVIHVRGDMVETVGIKSIKNIEELL